MKNYMLLINLIHAGSELMADDTLNTLHEDVQAIIARAKTLLKKEDGSAWTDEEIARAKAAADGYALELKKIVNS